MVGRKMGAFVEVLMGTMRMRRMVRGDFTTLRKRHVLWNWRFGSVGVS